MRYLYIALYWSIAHVYIVIRNIRYMLWTFDFHCWFHYSEDVLNVWFIEKKNELRYDELPWYCKPIRWYK